MWPAWITLCRARRVSWWPIGGPVKRSFWTKISGPWGILQARIELPKPVHMSDLPENSTCMDVHHVQVFDSYYHA